MVARIAARSEEHTSELQSLTNLVCRLLLEQKKQTHRTTAPHCPSTQSGSSHSCAATPPPAPCRRHREAPPHGAAHERPTVSFFFNDTATTEIYTLSLHDALPIWPTRSSTPRCWPTCWLPARSGRPG